MGRELTECDPNVIRNVCSWVTGTLQKSYIGGDHLRFYLLIAEQKLLNDPRQAS